MFGRRAENPKQENGQFSEWFHSRHKIVVAKAKANVFENVLLVRRAVRLENLRILDGERNTRLFDMILGYGWTPSTQRGFK
jgi:hypothetical protein